MLESIISCLNKLLQKAWFGNPLFHNISEFLYNTACLGYKIINIPTKEYRKKVITEWGKIHNPNDIKKLSKIMLQAWFKYGVLPQEYIGFDFEHCDKKKRESYISNVDGAKYCTILNDLSYYYIFKHKYETYLKYKKYYKRDVIKASDINNQFIHKHPKFIYKPESGHKGLQCVIIQAQDYSNIKSLKASIPEWNKGICEELIVQHNWAAMWHPQSANTCRIQTLIKNNDEVEIFGGFFRMGRGNAIVDNAFTGGILANIDVKTGKLNSNGYDERGHVYLKHPESNIVIKGTQIPNWEELCRIVKHLAKITPKIRIVGWDMILTDNGWVMIEGNPFGAFAQQYATGFGIKENFLKLMRT